MSNYLKTLALLVTLTICIAMVNSAPQRERKAYGVGKAHDFPASRQAEDTASSNEDTNEDDDDDDEEVVQPEPAAAVGAKDSQEDDSEEDDDDDDDLLRRRRREAIEQQPEQQVEQAVKLPSEQEKPSPNINTDVKETKQPAEQAAEPPSEQAESAAETVAVTTIAPPSRKPVLVLIRDALKKVTTELPTEQVANNALQYFQLFEHFIQQTIEQVIGDDDDEEDEAIAAAVAEVASLPETTAGDKKPEADTAAVESRPDKTEEISVPIVIKAESSTLPLPSSTTPLTPLAADAASTNVV